MITIDYKHEIFNMYSSPCRMCNNDFNINKYTCEAFPHGIPDEILSGHNQHKEKHPYQTNNITFKSKKTE